MPQSSTGIQQREELVQSCFIIPLARLHKRLEREVAAVLGVERGERAVQRLLPARRRAVEQLVHVLELARERRGLRVVAHRVDQLAFFDRAPTVLLTHRKSNTQA